jgi:hypothetical protein
LESIRIVCLTSAVFGEEFRVDFALAVGGEQFWLGLLASLAPRALAGHGILMPFHVARFDGLDIRLGHLLDLLLAADLAVEHLGDIGVVANQDQHRRHPLLPRRCLLDLAETLHPLAGHLQQRACASR